MTNLIILPDVAPTKYKKLMSISCKNTGNFIAVLLGKIRFALSHLIFSKLILCGLNLFSKFFNVQSDLIWVKGLGFGLGFLIPHKIIFCVSDLT